MEWELAQVVLSERVAIDVKLNCGGEITPDRLRNLGLLLQGIAAAAEKWRAQGGLDATALTRTPKLQGRPTVESVS